MESAWSRIDSIEQGTEKSEFLHRAFDLTLGGLNAA